MYDPIHENDGQNRRKHAKMIARMIARKHINPKSKWGRKSGKIYRV